MVILSLGPPTGAIDLCDLIADAMENFLSENLQNRQNCGHICTRFQKQPKVLRPFVLFLKQPMKHNLNIQLITAAVLSLGGLVLLFCGVFIDPEGQIHESLLVAFGEVATFSGALMGIDYVYKKKN